jgi:hypothetical protein
MQIGDRPKPDPDSLVAALRVDLESQPREVFIAR